MGKIHKITKNGQTIYPATTTDAVAHPSLKVSASKLIGEINVSNLYPTGGTDGTNKYTLESAIAKIPTDLRTVGIKCSFLSDAGELESWEYQGGTFTSTSRWRECGGRKFIELGTKSYPFVLAPSETVQSNSYIDFNNTIQVSGNYRIRKIQVKSGDTILIKGVLSGSIVTGLYSSDTPSNETLIEQYIKGYAGYDTDVSINTTAVSDGYLLITEDSNRPLLVVINSVFSYFDDVEKIKTYISSKIESTTYSKSVVYNSGIKGEIGGYHVFVIKLNVGDKVDYFIQGAGSYMMVGLYNSINLSTETFKKVVYSVTLAEGIKTVSDIYTCESEEEYIAFSVNEKYYFKVFLNSLFAFKSELNKEILGINTSMQELRSLIKNISLYKTTDKYYVKSDSETGISLDSPYNYAIDFYDVSEYNNEYIEVNGGVRGYAVVIWSFFSSEEISNETLVEKGDVWKDNSVITQYNKAILVPNGAKYLCVSRYKGEDNVITASVLSASSVEKKIAPIQDDISEINSKIGNSSNLAWSLKTKTDDFLAKQYANHNIPLLGRFNNRYDFGGVKLTEDIIVPYIGEQITIKIDKNPQVYKNYNEKELLFNVSDKICVGTKDVYDIYIIDQISDLSLTCTLLESNTGLIGETLQYQTSYTNSVSSKTATDYIQVFNYEDIISYNSNELPRSGSFDGVHPNANGRTINSYIIADVISSLYGKPTKIYSFGDSWTVETSGWTEVGTILGCQIVNKGISGDRIEHIIDRFLEFMETYEEADGDVFLFIMGTNNLLDISRNGADKNKQLYNSSYVSIFKQACETISERLPKGNWFVGNGHTQSNSIYVE